MPLLLEKDEMCSAVVLPNCTCNVYLPESSNLLRHAITQRHPPHSTLTTIEGLSTDFTTLIQVHRLAADCYSCSTTLGFLSLSPSISAQRKRGAYSFKHISNLTSQTPLLPVVYLSSVFPSCAHKKKPLLTLHPY